MLLVKDRINSFIIICQHVHANLPTTILTLVLHNNSWLFKRWITKLFTRLSA